MDGQRSCVHRVPHAALRGGPPPSHSCYCCWPCLHYSGWHNHFRLRPRLSLFQLTRGSYHCYTHKLSLHVDGSFLLLQQNVPGWLIQEERKVRFNLQVWSFFPITGWPHSFGPVTTVEACDGVVTLSHTISTVKRLLQSRKSNVPHLSLDGYVTRRHQRLLSANVQGVDSGIIRYSLHAAL